MLWPLLLLPLLQTVFAVRYEAESAFLAGRPLDLAQSFATLDTPAKSLYFSIFAHDSKHSIVLRYAAKEQFDFTVEVNGLAKQTLTLPSTESQWSYFNFTVTFRQGINTLSCKLTANELPSNSFLNDSFPRPELSHSTCKRCTSAVSTSESNQWQDLHDWQLKTRDAFYVATTSSVDIDWIEVLAGREPSLRGPSVDYVEYEAEEASTNGKVLTPDRTFTSIQAEASKRTAVQLDSVGQYVEFSATAPANALVLRYSLPDTTQGGGCDGTLGLYVGEKRITTLALTSRYSHYYGSYPFTKNPGDGLHHHWFDEVRSLLPAFAVGTKIRLQIDDQDVRPVWYVLDLIDLYQVPDPYARPSNFLSIVDFGADPSGNQDSSNAMDQGVAAVKSQKSAGLWIPSGTFKITRHIIVDDVTIRGAGPWYSILAGNRIGVYGNYAPSPSQNVKLYDFSIIGEVKERNDGDQVNGLGGSMGGGSVIQNLWIEHTKCGMWWDGPFSDLLITGVTIRDTTADGINFHLGISNAVVEQSVLRNLGDDGLAMWSEKTSDIGNIFRFNSVNVPVLANNIAIYGGQGNSAQNNIVYDTITQGGGLHVGNRFNSIPLAGVTQFINNTLYRTGCLDPNWRFGVGAIWFYALDSVMSGEIDVVNTQAFDNSYEAIMFIGTSVTNVKFDTMAVDTATFVLQLNCGGAASFKNVKVTGKLSVNGIYNCLGPSGFVKTDLGGNSGWDGTQCGYGPTQPPSVPPTPPLEPPTPSSPTPAPPAPTPGPPHNKTVISINSGGQASDYAYVADTDFNSGTAFSDGGNIDFSNVPSWEAAPAAVYQTCRYGSKFVYTISMLSPGKNYQLRLHWAELSFTASGLRKFNVDTNGQSILQDFDVFAAAGGNHKAYMKSFPITASSSGSVVIAFSDGSKDHAMISGIEVV